MANIEEAMCGKDASVELSPVADKAGNTYAFTSDANNKNIRAMEEIAPRYWIPVVVGKQAPQRFWTELVLSEHPKPMDEDDLEGVKPWWEHYEIQGGLFLKSYEPPFIKGIDPDEDSNERVARENDHGSDKHTENRKRFERAKKDAQREKRKRAQEKAKKLSKAGPPQIENDQVSAHLCYAIDVMCNANPI